MRPEQLPAGRAGAAAPRDNPAPTVTVAAPLPPLPAKQESAGASGAEIATPVGSEPTGPRDSDSLALAT